MNLCRCLCVCEFDCMSDPLLGENAYQLIYPRILQLIQQYNTQEIPLRLQPEASERSSLELYP